MPYLKAIPTRSTIWTSAALALSLVGMPGVRAETTDGVQAEAPGFPQVADTSRASPELLALLRSFYTEKNRRSAEGFAGAFAPGSVYGDLPHQVAMPHAKLLDAARRVLVTPPYQPGDPDTASYPVRVVGDANSAIIVAVNGRRFGRRGQEARLIASLTIDKSGKFLRWVDYWDARTAGEPPSAHGVPTPVALKDSLQNASPEIVKVAGELQTALAAGDVAGAMSLFDAHAVYEDMALHNQFSGRLQIEQYLTRALTKLPFGPGAKVAYVSGGGRGGGYEWLAGSSASEVGRGITALELDAQGKITRLSTIYNTVNLPNAHYRDLVTLTAVPEATQ